MSFRIKNILSYCALGLGLFSASTWSNNTLEQTYTFNDQQVDKFITDAFKSKSIAYSAFAASFNVCQKQPNHEQCGEKYQVLKTDYQRAKSIHESLVMAWSPEFKSLLLPPMGWQQLDRELTTLGYIPANTEVEDDMRLSALNSWLEDNKFVQTDQIYLIHGYLISADIMTQQKEHQL